MKKLILSLAAFCCTSMMHSQILQQENFETFTIGNVAVGSAVGQGGWSVSGSADSDFQAISSGTDKDLQITGAPANATTSRYMWKDGLDALWTTRSLGNNIVQVEYDFFTGPTTASLNTIGMELYNTGYTKILGGFRMEANTKVLYGVYSPVTGNPTLVNLGTTPITLPANQWVRVGWAYNTITGVITFKGPGFSGSVNGFITNDIFELDFVMENSATTGNTVSTTALFDNLTVKAVATETILGTSDVTVESNSISIFPNPAKDFITLKSNVKILNAYIYDMSGIRMNAKIVNGKIDVRNLETGAYILGLKTEDGLVTKKFIKE